MLAKIIRFNWLSCFPETKQTWKSSYGKKKYQTAHAHVIIFSFLFPFPLPNGQSEIQLKNNAEDENLNILPFLLFLIFIDLELNALVYFGSVLKLFHSWKIVIILKMGKIKNKKNNLSLSQPAHDVRTTLLQRYFNV